MVQLNSYNIIQSNSKKLVLGCVISFDGLFAQGLAVNKSMPDKHFGGGGGRIKHQASAMAAWDRVHAAYARQASFRSVQISEKGKIASSRCGRWRAVAVHSGRYVSYSGRRELAVRSAVACVPSCGCGSRSASWATCC